MANLGVKYGRRLEDKIKGSLPYKVRNVSGNWDPYLPLGENQYSSFTDSMACVTFSLLNCIETQEKFLTGKTVNYSDRWTAMMSDTGPDGNWLYKVADTVKQYGLVKEESWRAPLNFTWATYYAKPSAAQQALLLAEGELWKKTHDFDWEWLTTQIEDILKHLKQCPLQIVKPGHAIENFYQASQVTNYFDTYNPYKKSMQRSDLTDVLKPLLTMKGESMEIVNDNGTFFVVGEKGKIGLVDPDALGIFKLITDHIVEKSTIGIPNMYLFEKGINGHK